MSKRYEYTEVEGKVTLVDTAFGDRHFGKIVNGKVVSNNSLSMTLINKYRMGLLK